MGDEARQSGGIDADDVAALAQLLDLVLPAECVEGVRDNLILLADHAARIGDIA